MVVCSFINYACLLYDSSCSLGMYAKFPWYLPGNSIDYIITSANSLYTPSSRYSRGMAQQTHFLLIPAEILQLWENSGEFPLTCGNLAALLEPLWSIDLLLVLVRQSVSCFNGTVGQTPSMGLIGLQLISLGENHRMTTDGHPVRLGHQALIHLSIPFLVLFPSKLVRLKVFSFFFTKKCQEIKILVKICFGKCLQTFYLGGFLCECQWLEYAE